MVPIEPPDTPAGSTSGAAQGDLSFVPKNVLADEQFMSEVQRVADKHGISVADLLSVMKAENDTFDPARKNPNSSATGLIQFMDKTAKWLGTSTTELAGMSRAKQMGWVDKYFDKVGLPHGASKGQIYAAVFKPAALKHKDFVMYSQGSAEYEANKGLDTSGKGSITLADLENRASGSQGRGDMSRVMTARGSENSINIASLAAMGLDDSQISSIKSYQETIRAAQDFGATITNLLAGGAFGEQKPAAATQAAPNGANKAPPVNNPGSPEKANLQNRLGSGSYGIMNG